MSCFIFSGASRFREIAARRSNENSAGWAIGVRGEQKTAGHLACRFWQCEEILSELFAGLGRGGDGGCLYLVKHGVRADRALVKDGQGDGGEHEDDGRPGGEAGEDVGRGAGAEGGLRTLSAEGAGEIGRAALLEQNDADEEEADDDVQDDDEVEKDGHSCELLSRPLPVGPGEESLWCGGGDLNPYAVSGASTSS